MLYSSSSSLGDCIYFLHVVSSFTIYLNATSFFWKNNSQFIITEDLQNSMAGLESTIYRLMHQVIY